ncbi:MAG: hypothetical protein DSZ27_08325 [Thiomicrospira sp.]|nr:MAG: hypothetical protein DSZ27_08325 [Thiomicrospira sp.]
MKRTLSTTLFALFISSNTLAGGGHSHGPDGSHQYPAKTVAETVVIDKSAKKVDQLASAGKIDASWKGIKALKSEQKMFGHNKEWVITFNNPTLSDKTKQNLYLFYTLDGLYIAANYSGK